jgi:hypothetical protein
MSGSMKMRDNATEDAEKWPRVAETIGHLMRSLPGMKQYQVILFSDRVRYPFGGEGRWLDHDPRTSPAAVVDGLKRIAPQGDTNMSAAFAEAFRYRAMGLDTIYLLSDGLPTSGDGLPPSTVPLKETERSAHLCRHVRQMLRSVWNRDGTGTRQVRINAIGFYFDSPEVGAFLWTLAREHDGGFVGMSKP